MRLTSLAMEAAACGRVKGTREGGGEGGGSKMRNGVACTVLVHHVHQPPTPTHIYVYAYTKDERTSGRFWSWRITTVFCAQGMQACSSRTNARRGSPLGMRPVRSPVSWCGFFPVGWSRFVRARRSAPRIAISTVSVQRLPCTHIHIDAPSRRRRKAVAGIRAKREAMMASVRPRMAALLGFVLFMVRVIQWEGTVVAQ